MPTDLHILPKFRDGLSYFYVEHAKLEKENNSICYLKENEVVNLPVASLGVLLLGPGTSITHDAVKVCAEHGCSIQWTGQDGVKFYAQGLGETRRSARLLRQALCWAVPETRLQVVRRMYEIRFPETLSPDLTLQQIRGMEGARVRDTYARWAKLCNVNWSGRQYERGSWSSNDPVNRALSAANSCLYGVCHAAIVSGGYSPAIGFVHTGKMLSFVYDIADLYKVETTIPVAFQVAGDNSPDLEREVRTRCRQKFLEFRLLQKVLPDIDVLLKVPEHEEVSSFDEEAALPAWIWDGQSRIEGGVNYGCDDL